MKLSKAAPILFALMSAHSHAGDDWTSFYGNLGAGISSIDVLGFDGDIGYSAQLGYRFNRYIGIGLNYVDFGTAEASGPDAPSISSSGYYPSISAYWPATDSFDLYATIGRLTWELDVNDGQGQKFSFDGDDSMYALGGLVAVGNYIAFNFEYANYTLFEGTDMEYGSVGIRLSLY